MRYKTFGRWPTKEELIGYYSRDDIVAVLYAQSRRWPILLEFCDDKRLLEATSEKDARDKILGWLQAYTREVRDADKLPTYPALHLVRRVDHLAAEMRCDYMIDMDDDDWREALAKLSEILDVLDAHDVFYQIKFSGHTGPHLIIPAEAFPKRFRGRPFAEQFDVVCDKLKAFLPEFTDFPSGVRATYSTHPCSGMVSTPLYREELLEFCPWMISIHDLEIDWDWFEVPEDAVERNERFLHTVFEEAGRTAVSTFSEGSEFGKFPVKSAPSAFSEAEIAECMASDSPRARACAAHAALRQNVKLAEGAFEVLLRDSEPDCVWFGLELALRDGYTPRSEDIPYLLDAIYFHGRENRHYISLVDRLFPRDVQARGLADYLLTQWEISWGSVTSAQKLKEMDWEMFVELPKRVGAGSLPEWLDRMWVICGSALCSHWNERDPGRFFENVIEQTRSYRATEREEADAVHQLELLFVLGHSLYVDELKPEGFHREEYDRPIIAAAEELISSHSKEMVNSLPTLRKMFPSSSCSFSIA